MKIVVIGGTGLIGAKVVKKLRDKGHEVVAGIAQLATEGQTVRLPGAMMQPIVSDDVADVVVDVALAKPLNSTIDLAGPEPIRMDELVRQFLRAKGDAREVITDARALY